MRSAHIKNVKREIRQDTQSLKQLNTAQTIVGCVLFTLGPHGNLLIHLNLHSSHTQMKSKRSLQLEQSTK